MTTNAAHLEPDFRDTLPTANASGGRRWLYPRSITGRFTHRREALAVVLLIALFVGPFVWVDGHPLFLFNVPERRFIFFGVPFWPQDFYLVAFGLVTFIVFVALFTVIYGRVFCGWACPQTIFMEMVFRKIEVWIEGDYTARQRLDAAPWSTEKVAKKSLKHGLFLLVSFAISNTFLAYIIGRDEWLTLIADNPTKHLTGLAMIGVFTGVFYLVFARLREIVCTTICPYGRLQGVLLDKNSLVVAYDYIRGEPRGKLTKAELTHSPVAPSAHPVAKGDCIDCHLCVQVCPVGIDIRHGTQLECVNCTLCVDACDSIMAKIDRPPGLIRLDSLQGIEQRKAVRFIGGRTSIRTLAYTGSLVVLLGILGFMLISRPVVDVIVLRAPGQLFQREPGGRVSNLYLVEVINKTYQSIPVRFRLRRADARLLFVQPLSLLPAGELTKGMFFIDLPGKTIRAVSTPLTIDLLVNDTVVEQIETTFLGPEL